MMFNAPNPTAPNGTAEVTKSVARIDAVDSAKGIAIILVVFGHAWRGAMGADVIAYTALFRTIDVGVYAFHMPLFFFLSGLLFLETMQKYGTVILLRGRVTRLLWPMALWTWLFFGLKLAAGQSANTPVTLADFPVIPLPPYEHLWFLWALFLCQSLLILIHAIPAMRGSTSLWRWGAGAAALALALLNPLFAVPSLMFGPMVEHAPYILAGIAAGGLLAVRPAAWMGGLCGMVFLALMLSVGVNKAAVIHSLALVLLAWTAWQCIDRNGDYPALRLLRKLGKASMVIYLTHTIFTAALRILLLRLGVSEPSIILVGTVLIGLTAPFVVAWLARRFGIAKLLGL